MYDKPERELHILAGRAHPDLANAVACELDRYVKALYPDRCVELGNVRLSAFPSGETSVKLDDSVRGGDVFVLQTHCTTDWGSINDALMEQILMIDAARRASAASITAVCPFLGYARQDRMSSGREPISASVAVNMLVNAGAGRIMSVDLHSGQTQGFIDKPFDHLIAMPVLLRYLKQTFGNSLVVVSPDAGRAKVSERYIEALGCKMAIIHKVRTEGSVQAKELIGDVAGKRCVIIDDMIDTAGTICAAADLLAERGAAEVYGVATHGVLSAPALRRIQDSAFRKVILTDTLPLPAGGPKDKVEVLSVAPILAEAIWKVHAGESISEMFGNRHRI